MGCEKERSHLVVPLAEKLQLLCFLVHEHTVQVASLGRSNLDRFVTPAHDLSRADVSCRKKENIYRRGFVSLLGLTAMAAVNQHVDAPLVREVNKHLYPDLGYMRPRVNLDLKNLKLYVPLAIELDRSWAGPHHGGA